MFLQALLMLLLKAYKMCFTGRLVTPSVMHLGALNETFFVWGMLLGLA